MNKHGTLVSIIVPVYGTETYLPSCIESICRQTYSNLEIILVDDQSPDRCPEICEEYAKKDERIIVIHQKNKGVSGARNAGMRYANGEYIMFIDSDDELTSNAVEILLTDANDCDADIVSALKSVVSKEGAITTIAENNERLVYKENTALFLSLAGDRNTNSVCAKLFRSDFIKKINFEEGKNINEDGFFLFQCYYRSPVLVQHNVSIYQYNYRENSSSRQRFSDKYLSMLYFCERKKELIAAECPQYVELAYNMEVRTNLQFLDVLCSSGDRKYKNLQNQCIKKVQKLYMYHKPINKHHKQLAWIVVHGLYPLYKVMVRLKYYR